MLLFLILCFVVGVFSSSLDNAVKSDPDHVFTIQSYKDYTKYFKKKNPSQHRALLVVVGESMKEQCPYCDVFAEQFKFFSQHYYDVYSSSLVFSLFYYEQNEDLIQVVQDLEIQSVPTILLFTKGDNRRIVCPLQSMALYDCVKTHLGIEPPESVTKLIEEQKRQQNQQHRGGAPTGKSKNYYFFFGLAIPIAIILSYTTFIIFRPYIRKYSIFMILMVIYVLCMGCTVYNMIQTPGVNYGSSIIYPQQRVQMKYEGYVAAFIIVVFSLSWIALTDFLRTPVYRKIGKEEDRDSKKMRRYTKARKYISYFLICVTFGSFICVFHMYIIKYRWYLNDIPYWNRIVDVVANLPIKNLFEWYSVT